jgi:hypothetical protein
MSRRITLAQEKSFRSKNLPLSAGLTEIGHFNDAASQV